MVLTRFLHAHVGFPRHFHGFYPGLLKSVLSDLWYLILVQLHSPLAVTPPFPSHHPFRTTLETPTAV